MLELALRVEQLLLYVKHVEVIDGACLVPLLRNRQRPPVQADHCCQAITSTLFGIIDDERIVHLSPGLEHGVLVDNRRLLLLCLAQMERALETSSFEDGKR